MGLFDFLKKKGDGGPSLEIERQVREFVERLDSSDVAVRLAACRGLEQLGPAAESALPALQERIVDPDNEVCTAAASAMSAIERGV